MTWFKCQFGNGGGGGSSTIEPYFVVNPDDLDNVGPSRSSFNQSTVMPFLIKMAGGSFTEHFPKIFANDIYTFGRDYYQVCSTTNAVKIPHGKYKKLICDVQVVNDGSSYKHANLFFVNSLTFDEYGRPVSPLKDVILVSADKTSAEINAQTGVTIDSTTPTALARQTVEVDISDLQEDFYFGFWNCDVSIYFRSIKFDIDGGRYTSGLVSTALDIKHKSYTTSNVEVE